MFGWLRTIGRPVLKHLVDQFLTLLKHFEVEKFAAALLVFSVKIHQTLVDPFNGSHGFPTRPESITTDKDTAMNKHTPQP